MTDEELAQYNQYSEDWRHYNETIWQLPSIAVGLASAILAVAYQYIQELLPRTILLIFGGLILMSLTLALVKHRVFQDQRTDVLLLIEDEWIQLKKLKRRIGRKTEEIQDLSWFQRIGAYKCFLYVMTITTSCMFGLAFYNLFLLYRN